MSKHFQDLCDPVLVKRLQFCGVGLHDVSLIAAWLDPGGVNIICSNRSFYDDSRCLSKPHILDFFSLINSTQQKKNDVLVLG